VNFACCTRKDWRAFEDSRFRQTRARLKLIRSHSLDSFMQRYQQRELKIKDS
jgi:hypothetical protein